MRLHETGKGAEASAVKRTTFMGSLINKLNMPG